MLIQNNLIGKHSFIESNIFPTTVQLVSPFEENHTKLKHHPMYFVLQISINRPKEPKVAICKIHISVIFHLQKFGNYTSDVIKVTSSRGNWMPVIL